MKLPISQWAAEDRPSYKIGNLGAYSLTTTELLSIVIGGGYADMNAVEIARELMKENDHSLRRLFSYKIEQLSQFKGIGEQRASKIMAALELGKRFYKEQSDIVKLTTAESIYNYMKPRVYGSDTECFWVLYSNRNYKLLKAKKMFCGGLTEVIVDIRFVLKEALICNSTVFFCAHNHPSGCVTPSAQDNNITEALKKAAECLKIHFADHVIITDSGYYSYHENGLL